MVASEVRALFAVASRPEIVSLAGGMPNVSALPMDEIGEIVRRVLAERGAMALQYGSAQGDPVLREQICDVMSLEGIKASADDVIVTVGSQQALDLVTRVFVDPGDVVLAEAPTYVTAINTFAAFQADIVHVPMDEDGVLPEALEERLDSLAAAGRRVKFFYTVPNFQNPAGVTMNARRRGQVLEICRRHNLLVLEDNPYGLLRYEGEPMRALRADAPDNVIYLGSFSKTLSPGFRIGWALAPSSVRAKLVLAAESAMLSHSSFNQMVVGQYLASHPWREQVKDFNEMYRERRDAMLGALEAMMPASSTWTRPEGGFFVWATLPEGLDAKAMLPRAVSQRVAYVPGTGFFATDDGHRNMRLSFCYPTPEQIREGVRRLVGVIEAEIKLRDTFGSASTPSSRGGDAPGPDLP
ncbi:GntR family transcriptional regulator [Marinitenerispora sediminis]|uniref:GntR family transcriptional regulator n=2 Tax=Marinitenerispora sediminis TaxID=1931232 RepID=A0A368SYL1_9ACTN|nr:PLP-dependent aminotransferase family protein [Marinitenerispora sediminis]RCV49556.1 GntR family transcriptional regulator [Marinitenerispora sediminis]RCV51812.1 GntR family transcriptional regulator [Marinitenerispora sediminis]RCV54162.1 GntR family transcriptional regulator [Marinitenerispora sediminis]